MVLCYFLFTQYTFHSARWGHTHFISPFPHQADTISSTPTTMVEGERAVGVYTGKRVLRSTAREHSVHTVLTRTNPVMTPSHRGARKYQRLVCTDPGRPENFMTALVKILSMNISQYLPTSPHGPCLAFLILSCTPAFPKHFSSLLHIAF